MSVYYLYWPLTYIGTILKFNKAKSNDNRMKAAWQCDKNAIRFATWCDIAYLMSSWSLTLFKIVALMIHIVYQWKWNPDWHKEFIQVFKLLPFCSHNKWNEIRHKFKVKPFTIFAPKTFVDGIRFKIHFYYIHSSRSSSFFSYSFALGCVYLCIPSFCTRDNRMIEEKRNFSVSGKMFFFFLRYESLVLVCFWFYSTIPIDFCSAFDK